MCICACPQTHIGRRASLESSRQIGHYKTVHRVMPSAMPIRSGVVKNLAPQQHAREPATSYLSCAYVRVCVCACVRASVRPRDHALRIRARTTGNAFSCSCIGNLQHCSYDDISVISVRRHVCLQRGSCGNISVISP